MILHKLDVAVAVLCSKLQSKIFSWSFSAFMTLRDKLERQVRRPLSMRWKTTNQPLIHWRRPSSETRKVTGRSKGQRFRLLHFQLNSPRSSGVSEISSCAGAKQEILRELPGDKTHLFSTPKEPPKLGCI